MENSGKDLLKRLEEHCGEELQCSRRLRFQITSSIDRIIREHHNLRGNIYSLLNGETNDTYNNGIYRLHKLPKK